MCGGENEVRFANSGARIGNPNPTFHSSCSDDDRIMKIALANKRQTVSNNARSRLESTRGSEARLQHIYAEQGADITLVDNILD